MNLCDDLYRENRRKFLNAVKALDEIYSFIGKPKYEKMAREWLEV